MTRGFNNPAGAFMGSVTCAGCRGHEVEMKVYPGVSHGFAVVANMSDANAVAQKAAAFADTVGLLQYAHQPGINPLPSGQVHQAECGE